MQVNTIFHAFWLVNLEVIGIVLSTSYQLKKISHHFLSVLLAVNLFFGPLINQLGW